MDMFTGRYGNVDNGMDDILSVTNMAHAWTEVWACSTDEFFLFIDKDKNGENRAYQLEPDIGKTHAGGIYLDNCVPFCEGHKVHFESILPVTTEQRTMWAEAPDDENHWGKVLCYCLECHRYTAKPLKLLNGWKPVRDSEGVKPHLKLVED